MFKTPILRSDLYDFSDEYTVVKETIDLLVAAANKNDEAQKDVVLKTMLHLGHAFQKFTTHS